MLYLSHILTEETPSYGNQGEIFFNRICSIESGDNSNNTQLSIPAHFGTHIDAPYHFDSQGRTLESYPPEFWQCKRIHLMDYQAKAKEIIGLDQIYNLLQQMPDDTELLLLRTGFEKYRCSGVNSDYIFRGPGIDANIGLWLRENRQLKMIGFDFISLSSYTNRPLGRQAHCAFLSNNSAETQGMKIGSPILIIEDMHLAGLDTKPKSVWIVPLRYNQSDGAPVTVIAEN